MSAGGKKKGINRSLGWISYCKLEQIPIVAIYSVSVVFGKVVKEGDLTKTSVIVLSGNAIARFPASSGSEEY